MKLKNINGYWAFIILLAIVGFVLRVTNLDYLTIWVDEYVHVDRARFFPEQPLLTTDNNGILYTIFVIPFFKLFQVNEFWARFPSVILGTLSIPLIFMFCKKYFNQMIGLMVAILLTFSEYHVFWSRIARNYVIFFFFFLLFAYFLGDALNVRQNYKLSGKRFWDFLLTKPKTLLWTIAFFVAAMFSHQLAFLVIYAVGFYHLWICIQKLFRKEFKLWSVNTLIAILFFVFCIVTFIPAIQKPISAILSLFLPARVVTWVIPNLERLKELALTNRYDVFNLYFNIMKESFQWLYIFGCAGFLIALYRFKRSGVFLFSLFVPLLFLMSFIYREPSLPRYFIYLFPFFLMAIAVSFYEIYEQITSRLKSGFLKKTVWVAVIGVVIAFAPIKESYVLVKKKEHGQVVSKTYSCWFFPDWKTALNKAVKYIEEDDVVISTMPSYSDFYAKKKGIQLRQRYYNTEKHEYQNFEPDTTFDNANSLEGVMRLHQKYPRGWLFADYYFQNVMTDPVVRNYIVRNWDFHYALSDEYVKVFSWDKSRASTNTGTMLEILSPASAGTEPYTFNLPQLNRGLILVVDAEGVYFDNELLIEANQNIVPVLLKTGDAQVETGKRKSYNVEIPLNFLVSNGENKIRLYYNTNMYKYKKAMVAVYNIQLRF